MPAATTQDKIPKETSRGKMRRKDLCPNSDQDQSTGNFHAISDLFVQFGAQKDPCEREAARNDADRRAWPPDIGSQKSKAKADGESVQACGHREGHQGKPARRVAPELLRSSGHP